MGNSHKISAALSIMFPASLLLAGSIFTSYADTRRASAHPAPSAAPADTMESRQAALPARSAISLLAADVDTTDLEEVELPFRTIVEEVPDVDPVAWADTALFHFHNTATDSRYLRLTDDDYRTVAEEYVPGQCGYRYDVVGGLSWGIPYCVGVMALGWQVAPALTNEEMLQSLLDTAAPNADGLRIIDPVHFIETLEREYAS